MADAKPQDPKTESEKTPAPAQAAPAQAAPAQAAPAQAAPAKAAESAKAAVAAAAAKKRYGGASDGDKVNVTLVTRWPVVHPATSTRFTQHETKSLVLDSWIRKMVDHACMTVEKV